MLEDRKQIATHRVIALLNRQEVEFLDKLGKDSLFSTGHKLSYSEILKGLVEVARIAGLSAEGIDSLGALEERMLAMMKRTIEQGLTRHGE